ncbi:MULTISPECIES: acyl-CoA dehydrogenase family protein [Polaromonas]|uniref:Acyl-CoA dehydrogenase family protein n=1 Tax=Polaromonas aquatica TaxID=332657 RepID=A0ABW1U5L9_9BURK
MNLAISGEQGLLQEVLSRVFREHSTPARIRESEPVGFDRALWMTLVELEVPQLRSAADEGGASLMHAVLAAEQAGRHLASIPLVETVVTIRLLSLLGAEGKKYLDDASCGKTVVTLALQNLDTVPNQLIPAGAVADVIIGLAGGKLVALSGLTRSNAPVHGSIPALTLGKIKASERHQFPATQGPALLQAAIEEWHLLTAAMVTSAGIRALQLAAEYASDRTAFGRKIGEFQGVSHPLADSYTDLEGARLLCWSAADRIARKDVEAGATIAMAAWWCGAAARRAALRAMRTLGGYGMAMEYDLQLYFRRINAWSLCAGAPEQHLDSICSRLWDGDKVELPEAGEIAIDFSWGEESSQAIARATAFCEEKNTECMKHFMRFSGDGFDPVLQRDMAAAGLLYPDAPTAYGGPGLGASTAAAVRDVTGQYYWNLVAPSVTDMVAKTILGFGSEKARDDILPRLYSGQAYCTLGYSEPSGGSDIFAAKTTARRDGDDWLINGQKMFTSTAHLADYALMVIRTGEDKYRGLTLFIVPTRQAGFHLDEIKTLGDERTNVTFYSDVRVSDAYRIGEVNGGHKVLAAALTIEQSSGDLYVMSMRYLLRQALQWAQGASSGKAGKNHMRRTEVRRALAETATRLAVEDALNRRCVWASENRALEKHHGPMAKLFGSESWTSCAGRLMEVAAPDSLELSGEPAGSMEFMLRRAIPSTIYAGTSEVQRSLIAEAGLGLPRSR